MTSDLEIKVNVDSFLSELRKAVKEYRFMMPIEQFELADLAEVIIGNVRLVPFSSIRSEKEEILRLVESEDENKIWGDVLVRAESTEAKSKGEREIERVINLLRTYIPILFHKDHNIKIGLLKYDLNRSYDYLIRDDLGSIERGTDYLGPFGEYRINKKKYDDLKTNYCLNEISGILSKTPSMRSDLENSIIMAIRWLGLGIDDEVVSDKLLKFAIALECLLIARGEKGDKTDTISKRAAYILGTTASECMRIVSEVKLLYDIRSAIVHQGCEAEEEKFIEECVQRTYLYSMRTMLELSKKTTGPDLWKDIQCLADRMDGQMFTRESQS